MKIIQMQRRVSMVRFLSIGFLMLLVVCFGSCCLNSSIYQRQRYETADSVLAIFRENMDEFKEVTTILNDQELYAYLFEKFMSGEIGTYAINENTLKLIKETDLLTEEEYTTVVSFFRRYGPKEFQKGGVGGCNFTFIAKDRNITLYYLGELDDTERRTALLVIGQRKEDVFSIQDGWYYGLGEPHDSES